VYSRKILLVLSLVVSCPSSLFAEGSFTLDECLRAIRQGREVGVRSAILDIRVENKYVDPTVPASPPHVMRCYLDGEKMRRDSFGYGTSYVVSASIRSENKMVLRVPGNEPNAVSVMVSINDRSMERYKILNYLMIPDVRFLGTYLFWYNMYDGNGWILTPEAIFGMVKPLDTRLDPSTGATVLCWECFVKGFTQEFRAFVYPDMGWSISKIELVDIVDGQEFPVIVTSVRNKRWETGNVIFPDLIITNYYRDGGIHFRTETITIENARFNIPIAPEIFELEGMDLPEGIGIYDETASDNPSLQWSTRDGKAVPWTGPPQEEYELPQASRGNVIFRVVCMLIGLLMILYALRIMWKNKHDS